MKNYPIGTVVNFCTNESRFIATCLQEALKFSSHVVVPVASHFFDGTEENLPLLEEIYAAFPECLFIEYPFIPEQIPAGIFQTIRQESFWHCLSRLIGVNALAEEVETVLFLDADEVADADGMLEWLECSGYAQYTVQKLANYWYFREPIYRAEGLEDSIVLAQRKALTLDLLLQNGERSAIYDLLPGPKKRMVAGADGLPLFHHFSWVRTEEEMLKKVKSWGHKSDRNWKDLVRNEFSAPFSGTDFVHGYRFQIVPSVLKDSPFPPRGQKNVIQLTPADVIALLKRKKVSLWNQLKTLIFRAQV